jgi:hypothetical protein
LIGWEIADEPFIFGLACFNSPTPDTMTTEIELMKRWEDLCSSGSQVPPLIERQFVSKVTGFSSEYGAGDSNWGACNICGKLGFEQCQPDTLRFTLLMFFLV